MNKKYILTVAMALIGGMYGCALEDAIVACGDSRNPALGLIDGNPNEPVSSYDDVGESSPLKAEHFEYIKKNECPSEWYCVDVEDEDAEIVGKACSLCPEVGQVMCGECVNIKTDRENCGKCGNACSDYEKCRAGVCVETVECKEAGMHASHGECVEDTLEECGAGKVNCTQLEGWRTGECQNSACIAETCEADYALKKGRCIYMDQCDENQHLYGNKCEENDMDNCGVHGRQCKSVTGFEDGFCSKDGECVATSCQENFCNHNGVCQNGKYNADYCGIAGKCTQCNSDEQCVNGACIVNFCGENKHVTGEGDDTTCEEDSLENCGSHGNSCVKENVDQMACVNGKCEVQKCSDGYHPHDGGCEKDDINNCGSHGNQCAGIIANWSTGTCENEECKVKSCVTGHVYENNNICEEDSLENCGAHGNVCHFDNGTASCHDGVCKLENCDKNYFVVDGKCNPNRTGGLAENGEYIDPWGLVWDRGNRPKQPHADAVKKCKDIGGRLPTPTEIYRNNSETGEKGLSDDIADPQIWTDTPGLGADKAEVMFVKNGAMDSMDRTKDMAYRCVWDPVERPFTFTGVNCHGSSSENGCVSIKLGDKEYIVDRRDRPKQYWVQAAEECRKMGARLPTTAELYSLIRAGLPNGSGTKNKIWASPTKTMGAATFGWAAVGNDKTDYTEDTYRNFGQSMKVAQQFRCISEPVKLVDNKPVFPQPKINLTFEVDPLLRMDSSAREKATYFEAAYNCFKDGGHLAGIDEMTAAIRAGLNHDDNGSEYYWTSNLVATSPTRIKFTNKIVNNTFYYYANADNVLSGASYSKEFRYYCAYRPENNYNLSGLSTSNYNVINAGNVTHYVSKKDILENTFGIFKMFSNTDYVMRIKGMRLPTDTELVSFIKQGLENGSGELVMTSNPHYSSDSFVYLGIKWSGRSNASYDPSKLIKNIGYGDKTQRPYRMYATTVMH
ncbi:MAG: hypothetical protein IJU23_06950 [Proteobacteria bacterium]|nr:hypothetical protein [Pseudomonadota bacterium]